MATTSSGDRELSPGGQGLALTVAAVARRLGVAPATLRTWDRRYGLGPSEHLAGSHRRYSSTDVSRLLVMRRLTLEGVAPSEAARSALSSDHAPSDSPLRFVGVGEVIDAFADAAPMAADPPALIAAAIQFDNAAVRWMLARVEPRDVLAWWSDLVQPALRTLAERGHPDRPGEAATASLVAAAFAELRSRSAVATARAESLDRASALEHEPARPTVLAVASGEGPELVVHVLATALQSHGVQARVLGGGNVASIPAAIDQLEPSVLLLDVGASAEGSARAAEVLHAVSAADRAMTVFLHREGNAPIDVPVSASVHRVRTLTGALHEVLAVMA